MDSSIALTMISIREGLVLDVLGLLCSFVGVCLIWKGLAGEVSLPGLDSYKFPPLALVLLGLTLQVPLVLLLV